MKETLTQDRIDNAKEITPQEYSNLKDPMWIGQSTMDDQGNFKMYFVEGLDEENDQQVYVINKSIWL